MQGTHRQLKSEGFCYGIRLALKVFFIAGLACSPLGGDNLKWAFGRCGTEKSNDDKHVKFKDL
jgi:hypothetical protein